MGKKYTTDEIHIGGHELDAAMMVNLNTVVSNHTSYLTSLPSHTHDDRYVQEGGTSFNGVYPMVVRVSNRSIYSDADITFTGSTSQLQVGGSVKSPIFYDSNNTGYYLNPASTSNLYDLSLTGAKHTYLYINPGNNYEAMVRFNGGSGNTWYVGSRTSSDLIGSTDAYHVYSQTAARTVGGYDTSGSHFAYGSSRAPLFYDLDNTGYYINPTNTSNVNIVRTKGLGVNTIGNQTDKNGLSLYGAYGGGEPTYGIMFSGTAGSGTHGAVTSDWATYFTMNSASSRGWIFRRVGSGNSASISAVGAATFDTSVTSNKFYDTNNTNSWLDIRDSSGNYHLKANEGGMYFDAPVFYFRELSSTGQRMTIDGGTATATSSLRAPIFYDSNNTGYFLNPAGSSRLGYAHFDGYSDSSGNARTSTGVSLGRYTSEYAHIDIASSHGSGGWIDFSDTTSEDYGGRIRYYNSSEYMSFYSGGSNEEFRINSSYTTALGSSRAPVFYDSNDTGYYLNPASTSRLDKLTDIRGNYATHHIQSGSNFVDGTLVTTDIAANNTNGDSYIIEVTGKSYSSTSAPFSWIGQGYLYNNTIISHTAVSQTGIAPPYMKVFNHSDNKLAFWWPRWGYWNSFEVRVRRASGNSAAYNAVTAITNSTEPSSTKKVQTDIVKVWTENTLTNNNQLTNGAGYITGNYLPLSGGTLTGDITVGSGQTSSNIYMADSNETARRIHTNSGRIGFLTSSNGWGAYCSNNGDWTTDFVSYAGASMKAPIFYDSNDTNYYGNFASNSRYNTAQGNYLGLGTAANTSGGYRLNMGGSVDMNANSIDYISQLHFNDNVRFYDDGNDSYLNFKYGDATTGGIVFKNGGGSIKGYVYANADGFGLLDNDGYWAVQTQTGTDPLILYCDNNPEFLVYDSYTYSPGSSRAPIFYDSDNTSYYLNPAETSNLNGLTVQGTTILDSLQLENSSDYITFYGGNSTQHSITSRQLSGQAGDDLRFNTYGSFIINLDSNNNQSNAANSSFYIARHGGASGDLSSNILFDINGENGDATFTGDIAVTGTVDGVDISALPTSFAPTNAEANVQSDWNATSGDAFIQNKPTIPTNNNQLTNGAGYTTYSANQNVNTTDSPAFSNLYVADHIFHTGDTNTYMQFHAADQWRVVTGGVERLEVNNSQVTVANNLQVNGSIYTSQYIYHTGDIDTYMRFPSNDTISWNTAGSERLRINSLGNVGIGTTTPGQKLTVNGRALIQNNTNPIYIKVNSGYRSWVHHIGGSSSYHFAPSTTNGGETWDWSNQMNISTTGVVTANNFVLASDKRSKTKIEDLTGDNVDISWKSFEMKGNEGEYRTGVIAQELEENHPEFVNTDEKGYKTVKYIDLLIAKIAELEARLEKIEK